MSTALAPIQNHQAQMAMSFEQKIRYCETLANAGMLPEVYRKNPANCLVALELGATLGLPAVLAMLEIYVVSGRPCMSAKLMNALVRQAGHTIRIDVQPTEATCIIVRREDPSSQTRVTFSLEQATKAGLAGKDVWKSYPQAMLANRAISACVRLACPDVVMGLSYTPEELGDDGKIEMIQGEVVQAVERPAEEPGTTKAYNQIQTSEPTKPTPRQRRQPAEKPAEEPAQETATAPAEESATDDPPATEEARGQVMVAWKALYGFNPATGEKDARLAQQKLADIFPGWAIKSATCGQLAKIMEHVEAEKLRLEQKAGF